MENGRSGGRFLLLAAVTNRAYDDDSKPEGVFVWALGVYGIIAGAFGVALAIRARDEA